MLADNTELTGHPSALAALEETLNTAGPELVNMIHTVKTTTLPNINAAVSKAPDAVASIRSAGDSISSILGDSTPDFRGTVANLHAITDNVKEKLPGMLQHFDTIVVNATTALDNASGTLADLKTSVANAKDITATARSVIVDNHGKLDGIIASLKGTSDNLKSASAEIRRSPWRLLYQPGPGELANLQLYDAARQFADGASGVNDAAIALHDALQDPNVDKAQLQKLVDHLNATFVNFDTVEDKLWKAVKPE
jgi:ABC-type transporter Mla subunit MlaD